MKQATLVNVEEFEDDFRQFYGDEVYLDMLAFEGTKVKVLCEATDDYYDVEMQNGITLFAISSYHLIG